jgi:predicted ATPase
MGLPQKSSSAFHLDPEIKREVITFVDGAHKSVLLERQAQTINARDAKGKRVTFPGSVNTGESVLSGLREPHLFPEISALRQEILAWRFYHQFRTDTASPLRQAQIGVRTPVLAHDGSDLGAALQTILEIGDRQALHAAIDRAFPGSELCVQCDNGRFEPALLMPGFDRPFLAAELSDGTLHYLCLVAALLACRPPTLIALNEPETSIHPDLFESLSRLISQSSRHSQIWVTTHSQQLADFLLEFTGAMPLELTKKDGATKLKDVNILGEREPQEDAVV